MGHERGEGRSERRHRSRSPRRRRSRSRSPRSSRSRREERSSGRDYERSERSERSSRSESSSTPAERKLTPPIPEPFGEDEHAQDAGKTKDQLEDERIQQQYERDLRTIIVLNLHHDATEDDIFLFMEKHAGKVRDVRLITDKTSRRSKGMAYVEFYQREAVGPALSLTGQRINNKPVVIQLSQAEKNLEAEIAARAAQKLTEAVGETARIRIDNLNPQLTGRDVRDVFAHFGEVLDIVMAIDEQTGVPKGYAFIQFRKMVDADTAITSLHNQVVACHVVRVRHASPADTDNLTSCLKENVRSGNAGISNLGQVSLMASFTNFRLPDVPTVSQARRNRAGNPLDQHPHYQCLLIRNCFNLREEIKDGWEFDVRDEIVEECSRYGRLTHVFVDRTSQDGRVYVRFEELSAARRAAPDINRRWFAGRLLSVEFVRDEVYLRRFPNACDEDGIEYEKEGKERERREKDKEHEKKDH
eukprot:TRINITY_DN4141_c0_g1_i1.p1 TRINITY_DN4141_c0_g1~~TRINITY_DN4141_c0_g1_i1.p1  ORF type:complete len:473 (-),score=102.81 TRINITY_DN4141_c0_g1_i1:24-1442(-)